MNSIFVVGYMINRDLRKDWAFSEKLSDMYHFNINNRKQLYPFLYENTLLLNVDYLLWMLVADQHYIGTKQLGNTIELLDMSINFGFFAVVGRE